MIESIELFQVIGVHPGRGGERASNDGLQGNGSCAVQIGFQYDFICF